MKPRKSKYHRIWLSNNDNGDLVAGFAESEDKIKDSVSRYYCPNQISARRLEKILRQSLVVPFLFLHEDGPCVTYYIERPPRRPVTLGRRRMAVAA